MEKTQIAIENPSTKPLFTFSAAIRHRHLKSDTYNTFVNIFSHLYQNPSNSHQGEKACDFGGGGGTLNAAVNEGEVVDKEQRVSGDVLDRIEGMMGVEGEGGSGDVLDQIEEMMGYDEIEGLLEQNDEVSADGDGREELVVELESIIKGNGEVAAEGGSVQSSELIHGTQCDGVDVSNEQNFCVRLPNVEMDPPLIEIKDSCRTASIGVNLDLSNSVIAGKNCGENGFNAMSMGVNDKKLLEVADVDNSVCNAGMLSSLDRRTEEVEVEEGELPVDLTVVDENANNIHIKSLVLKEKEDGIPMSDDKDVQDSAFDEQERADNSEGKNGRIELGIRSSEEIVHKPGLVAVEFKMPGEAKLNISELEHGRKVEKVPEAIGRVDDISSRRGNLVFYGDIMDKSLTKIKEKESNKKDAGVGNKRKRGPLTEERKAKKKEKKRKKRAEKNRQLGVKRLKLTPVMKPKTVSYCRHYLKGRCQEGEKCKFSHDTVPLTKSTPCCHFARHSCMKGDDCPFDHQLSKYPCTNFVSKGFCSRGDECMFSHKIPLTENFATNLGVGNSELKTSTVLVNSNSRQLNVSNSSSQNKALSHSEETNMCKKSEKVTETPVKHTISVSEGAGSFSDDFSRMVDSTKLKQGDSAKSKNNVQIQNLIGQSSNSTPNKTAMASRGINFLSFGKTMPNNALGRISDNSPSIKNSNLQKQASRSLITDESNRVGNLCSQRSNRIEDSNEGYKISQPFASPLGVNFLSFGKASSDCVGKQSNHPSSNRNGTAGSSQEPSPSSRPSVFSSFPWRLSGSRLISGQPSDSTTVLTKDTPNSAQKALFSTLAFAAKIEAKSKMKSSSDGGETTKAHNDLVQQNDST